VGTEEVKRACVKSNWFHQEPDEVIRLDDLNDPRLGGHASPKGEGGLSRVDQRGELAKGGEEIV
jgi:hypothetical protein